MYVCVTLSASTAVLFALTSCCHPFSVGSLLTTGTRGYHGIETGQEAPRGFRACKFTLSSVHTTTTDPVASVHNRITLALNYCAGAASTADHQGGRPVIWPVRSHHRLNSTRVGSQARGKGEAVGSAAGQGQKGQRQGDPRPHSAGREGEPRGCGVILVSVFAFKRSSARLLQCSLNRIACRNS
jgi:hypothetical protein